MSKKVSIPFGKHTIKFPYDPIQLADKLKEMVYGQVTKLTWSGPEGIVLFSNSMPRNADGLRETWIRVLQNDIYKLWMVAYDIDGLTTKVKVKQYTPGLWEKHLGL